MAFSKLYKGPKRYFPGEQLKCSFESSGNITLDGQSMKVLKSILSWKKIKKIKGVQDFFPGKQLNFTKKPIEFPCPIKNCKYQGPKLKRHLKSKSHKFTEESARTYESFLRTYMNHITLISKFKSSKPSMCYICKGFFERIDSHFNNFHQLKRQLDQMKRALQKSIISTKEFLDKYFQKTTTPVTSSDDEVVEPSSQSIVSINPTSPELNVNPSETAERDPHQQEKEIEKEKDIEKNASIFFR